MQWFLRGLLAVWLGVAWTAFGQDDDHPLTHRHWFEARTAHFNVYSCGTPQEVYKVVARLEQFHDAYGLLAGAQAVNSPPITVMAFPDQAALRPFLPLYHGQPANLSGFFRRDVDENLIVLALTGTNSGSLDTIFHEYTHLLLRHNDHIWPLWLQEGMAEIYSTFEATGRGVTIGKPINHHLRLLARDGLMPLSQLLAVDHDSPEYNESEHQGIFYAESWLLTHFLMNGDNPVLRERFKRFTPLLRAGKTADQAFAEALQMPLPAIEAELKRYLERGQFQPIGYVVAADLSAPRQVATRPFGEGEACFRLGNELLRIDRPDDAEPYFQNTQKLLPNSPLPYEGLGMLAMKRNQTGEAVNYLKESLQRHSTNFLAHYLYARERLHSTGDSQDRYARLDDTTAAEIRGELQRSIELTPSFGPAQEALGFLELLQADNLTAAEQHLQRAIQLDPDNPTYLLSLAQAQMRKQDFAAARHTLEPLTLGSVDPKLRATARQILDENAREERRKSADH